MGYYFYSPILWALAISLTTFAGVWTFFSWRRGRHASAVRGVGLMILPFAALFTGTLTLVMRMLDAVALWATGFVFRPTVWVGLLLFAVAAGLFVLARRLGPPREAPGDRPSLTSRGTSSAQPADVDTEIAEIEDILRNRGIT